MTAARFPFLGLLVLLAGCSTAPKTGEVPETELLEIACPPGFASHEAPKSVKGSVWARIASPEMKGQFPATVLVEYPRRLAVEVTNLIGSPQAWLRVEGGRTELRFTAENAKSIDRTRAHDMLGGLPVALAPRLFAGGVPCPSVAKDATREVNRTESGGIEVVDFDPRTRDRTRYLYDFSSYAGRPWVKGVEWERLEVAGKQSARPEIVRIVREEPTDPDGAPLRWSASSERGEIRIRWKDRLVGSR